MKRLYLFASAAALLLVACNNETKTTATINESSAPVALEEPWVPVDSATAMQKFMEYATPGPMHAMMASWNGTWNAETTMWEYDGAAPGKSTGRSVNSMIMGDKYQMSKHSGSMMGMPFEGMSLMGYDNAKKEFNSSWVDVMGSGVMYMTGKWDEATKTLSMIGKMPDICRPGKECSMRELYTIVDANTQKMEMYCPDPKTGKEYKMMEIKMTRAK